MNKSIQQVKKETNIIYGNIVYIIDFVELQECDGTEVIDIESKGHLYKSYVVGHLINFIKKNPKFKVAVYKKKRKWIHCFSVYHSEEYHLAYLKRAKCEKCGKFEDIICPPMTIGPSEELYFGFGELRCLECGGILDKHSIKL